VASANIWNITHNLNLRPIGIIITDTNYNVIIPETIQFTSGNVIKIVFSTAQNGYAHLSFGTQDFAAITANVLPNTNLGYNLGASDKRWNTVWCGNVNTSDIIMKNENGHYTIDEQADYLRVYNHSNGKYYKLLMEEI
jgi:hypothetical protein